MLISLYMYETIGLTASIRGICSRCGNDVHLCDSVLYHTEVRDNANHIIYLDHEPAMSFPVLLTATKRRMSEDH